MTVAELRTILEHLPDELEVLLDVAPMTCHVRTVERTAATTVRYGPTMPGSRFDTRWPSVVRLRCDGSPIYAYPKVGWWLQPPPIQLRGPFRRAAELERCLDALSPIGGPTS